ncbi:MAG: hypothetical protein OXI95_03600 [bacterium]|nr:hypothetical protein [bacterium]
MTVSETILKLDPSIDGGRSENHRRWFGTGVTVALPLGFTVGGNVEIR